MSRRQRRAAAAAAARNAAGGATNSTADPDSSSGEEEDPPPLDADDVAERLAGEEDVHGNGGGVNNNSSYDGTDLSAAERDALSRSVLALEEPALVGVPAGGFVTSEYPPPAPGVGWLWLDEVGAYLPLPANPAWRLLRGTGKLLSLPVTTYVAAWHPTLPPADGAVASDFLVAVTLSHTAGVLASGSLMARAAAGSPAGLARVLMSLHMVRAGPVGGVTGDDDGEPVAGGGNAGVGAPAGGAPEVLSTWHRTTTRVEAGLAAPGEPRADAPVHVFGMEYVVRAAATTAGGAGATAGDLDAGAATTPGALMHASTTLVLDEGDGSLREASFRCPDAWWEALWASGLDAADLVAAAAGVSSRGGSARGRRRVGPAVQEAPVRYTMADARAALAAPGSPPPPASITGLGPGTGFSAAAWMDALTFVPLPQAHSGEAAGGDGDDDDTGGGGGGNDGGNAAARGHRRRRR